MKLTGYEIKEHIKRAEMVRDATASLFDGSLSKFKDEQKESPQEIVNRFKNADAAIARLQVIQAQYNLMVMVDVLGEEMTLCEAVKRVGGAGRTEKMWRSAAVIKKERYSYRNDDDVRDPNMERSERTISKSQALELATEAARYAGAIRAAIAKANGTEIEFPYEIPKI